MGSGVLWSGSMDFLLLRITDSLKAPPTIELAILGRTAFQYFLVGEDQKLEVHHRVHAVAVLSSTLRR